MSKEINLEAVANLVGPAFIEKIPRCKSQEDIDALIDSDLTHLSQEDRLAVKVLARVLIHAISSNISFDDIPNSVFLVSTAESNVPNPSLN